MRFGLITRCPRKASQLLSLLSPSAAEAAARTPGTPAAPPALAAAFGPSKAHCMHMPIPLQISVARVSSSRWTTPCRGGASGRPGPFPRPRRSPSLTALAPRLVLVRIQPCPFHLVAHCNDLVVVVEQLVELPRGHDRRHAGVAVDAQPLAGPCAIGLPNVLVVP